MRIQHSLVLCVVVMCSAVSSRAQASPSLRALLEAGHHHALSADEQSHVVAEQQAAREVAAGALWPSLTASAAYTRNQHEVTVAIPRGTDTPLNATITPLDQLDASLQLNVPLLDLSSRRQVTAAEADLSASRASLKSTMVEVDRGVVRAYYQWLGGQALVRTAQASQAAAVSTVAQTQQRATAGLSVELDLARARTQLLRTSKAIADARLIVAGAVRQLATLTGVRMDDDAPSLPESIDGEPPVEHFLGDATSAPEVDVANANRAAAQARAAANSDGYIPVISAFARERLSNATGFGDAFNWAAGVQLSWTLDRRTMGRVEQARAAESTNIVRVARAEQDARDRIVDAWDQVEALRAAAAAARAQAESAQLATQIAQTRNSAGTATTQQVTDALADQLDSEVQLVRARADLAAARALLRLAAGQAVVP